MLGKDLSLGAASVNQMLNTVTNDYDHIAKGFHARAVNHCTARRNDAERTIGPSAESAQQTVQRATLRRINGRITIAGKYIAKIDQLGHVKMHDGVRVAVTRLLMNNVDRIVVHVEGQHFRERDTRAVDP